MSKPADSSASDPSFRGAIIRPAVSLRTYALLAVLVATALALLPAAAQAGQARVFVTSFGAASNPAPTPANPYPLSEPAGVAVDNATGDVYVADRANHRVEKFTPGGAFILMFGKDVDKTAVEAAAPEAQRNLCTAASGDECQIGTAATTPGAFQRPSYLAVDNSSGPSVGDVYVAESEGTSISKFDSSGHLLTGWASGGLLDGSTVASPPAPLPGPFEALHGVAVDTSGNLWVYGTRPQHGEFSRSARVFEFGQDASFITDWDTGFSPSSAGLAVDANDDVFLGISDAVFKYEPTGTLIGRLSGQVLSLAADPSTEDLYAAGGGSNSIFRYPPSCPVAPGNPSCTPAETFSSPHLRTGFGLAVDPTTPRHTIYAAQFERDSVAVIALATLPDVTTAKASGFDPIAGTATLNGTVDPAGVELAAGTEGCRFEWGLAGAPYEHLAPCDKSAAQIGAGSGPVAVHADLGALTPGATYHFRLLAANADNLNEPSQGADLLFGPPAIDSESVAAVTSSSATLRGEVNPQNVATGYHFEYGPEAGVYTHSTPELAIGSSGSDQSLAVHLQGLQPQATYHYRLVADNVLGTTSGADLAFTTQSPAATSLPDARQWELVSPPDKHGALLLPISLSGLVQAAASGGALTILANAPTEAEPEGNGAGSQILAARAPAGGWASRDIGAPHTTPTGVSIGQGYEYRAFSPDLATSVLQPIGAFEPSLSPQATEQTAFLRATLTAGQFCTASCYDPLVTGSNVPEGIHFGEEGKCLGAAARTYCGPQFFGATPDLSHLVLNSSLAGLTPGSPADSLYESSAGRLALVSVLPDGEPAKVPSPPDFGPAGGNFQARGMISADGSRLVFRSAGSLFLRVNTDDPQSASGACDEPERACTIRLDAQQGGIPGTPAALLQGASADDSTIYFSDEEALTPDSGAEGNKPDLYECEIAESESGELECELTDLTPRTAGGESAALPRASAIPGVSTDGSSVYFVAEGDLTGAQANDRGAVAQPAQPNLYLYREGHTTFIAGLSSVDNPDWSGQNLGHLGGLTARVSPDGRWLAFMSNRPLTGYENHDAVSGEADEEVFLFHAPSAAGEPGTLLCASCNPTGARPEGVRYGGEGAGGEENLPLAGGAGVWDKHDWLAANIPGWTAFEAAAALYQSRYLSDSGRLFFNSSDALLPSDTNGLEDVYQYEPAGVGDCAVSSATYFPDRQGCLGLISSGASSEESAFLDASESGDDVFFLTTSRLDPKDIDGALDVYDAHVCSAESPCPPAPQAQPPACEGDACQAPAVPPNDPTPGSLTFNGAGNVVEKPAKKKHPKKHNKHKKSRGKKSHRAASHNRGGRK